MARSPDDKRNAAFLIHLVDAIRVFVIKGQKVHIYADGGGFLGGILSDGPD